MVLGGGPIFAIRCKVLSICDIMTKIVFVNDGAADENTAAHRKSITLNSTEKKAFATYLEKMKLLVYEKVESMKELSLPSLVEEIDCSETVRQLLMVSS